MKVKNTATLISPPTPKLISTLPADDGLFVLDALAVGDVLVPPPPDEAVVDDGVFVGEGAAAAARLPSTVLFAGIHITLLSDFPSCSHATTNTGKGAPTAMS